MMPKAILFDLDDTLFDHQRSSHIALRAIHVQYASDVDFNAFSQSHAHVLEVYHKRFLAGELTLDQARAARMIELFAGFGLAISEAESLEVGALYRQQHQVNRALVAGALELLQAVHGQAKLGIVTNNSTAEQIEKLRFLSVDHFFDAVVISEDVGVTKPDKRIFDIALERLQVNAHDTVMIGDSWHADVMGALDAGIAAVWLNRKNETPALERLSGQKWLESHASAGVSKSFPNEIKSLLSTTNVLAAIQNAFKKDTLGLKETHHAELETLAT